MSSIRPLPAHPSIEFDRKQSKALLSALRSGDPGALERAGAQLARSGTRHPNEWTLADAQRVIAREYGLPTWPRLVAYLADLDRQRNAPRHNRVDEPNEQLERRARSVLRRHASRDEYIARDMAQYLPHCYGKDFAEIFATAITLDDARLVVARQYRCASWDALLQHVAATTQWQDQRRWEASDSPMQCARAAIRTSDVVALSAVLDAHPDLVTPSDVDVHYRQTLARLAVDVEFTNRTPAARAVTELLTARGAEVQRELDAELLGWWPMQHGGAERVRWMLERGANPLWTPPNGISVLEHAIVRFHDRACVDLIARLVTPAPALWIAAGLGDVAALRRCIAGRGRLTATGRRHRPDLIAMGVVFGAMPVRQDADDLEIMWEAFRIAGWNERWHTMDALLDAGLPIDHAPLGIPLIAEAALNMHMGTAPLAEYLVTRGADLDRDWGPRIGGSVRAALPSFVESLAEPLDPAVQRMLDICDAGTVRDILAIRDARPRDAVKLWPITERVLLLAADDASARGAIAVGTEHLLVGWLRVHGGGMADLFAGRHVDMARLRMRLEGRLRADTDPLAGGGLPLDEHASAAVRVATERAEKLQRDGVSPGHLLIGILEVTEGPGSTLLRDAGVTAATFGVDYMEIA